MHARVIFYGLCICNPGTMKASTAEVIQFGLQHDREHPVRKEECCTSGSVADLMHLWSILHDLEGP